MRRIETSQTKSTEEKVTESKLGKKENQDRVVTQKLRKKISRRRYLIDDIVCRDGEK